MEVLYPRCAGLDVHSRRVNGCVRVASGRTVTTLGGRVKSGHLWTPQMPFRASRDGT